MLTLQYARAFAADPLLAHVKINAVTPGYVATDMNRGQGNRSARVIVEFARSHSTDGLSAALARSLSKLALLVELGEPDPT